jgi:glycosyltransferase involved in cell wall biosynthesis
LANGIAAWAGRFLWQRPRIVISERNALLLVMGEVEAPAMARPAYQLLMRIIRHSYRYADALVAVSEGVAERVRRIPGLAPERVHVIYNPAYPQRLEASLDEKPDHPWLMHGDIPVVLSVGRLVVQKDFATLLRAVELLNRRREVRLIILGDGEERAELEQLVSELGISDKVSLPGFSNIPLSYMEAASVFVLSSFQEGFGNAIVEAMACGTPIVSTDSPGPREILEGGRLGPLVQVGNAEALAAAVEQQLDGPTPANLLQARAREFSLETSADAYLKLAHDTGIKT